MRSPRLYGSTRDSSPATFAGDTRPLIGCELGTAHERAARKLAAVLAMFASMVKVPVTDDARLFQLLKQRMPELRRVTRAEVAE